MISTGNLVTLLVGHAQLHCTPHPRRDSSTPGNLDFDARVPIPFSVFPSSYSNDSNNTTEESTHIRVEGEANLPRRREDQETKHSSFSASIDSHHRPQYEQDDVRVYQDDRDRRTRRDDDVTVYEEDRYRRRNHFPEVELSREK
ncbi:MAG: hypothetical protein Q9180_003629 [Flavoplaca navasiana]